MSTRTLLTRRVIVALLMVPLTACHSWRATAVRPEALIPVEQPSAVRVTLRNGAIATVDNPTMRNDSIFGVTDAGLAGAVGVASRDVGLLEVREFSITRTLGLGFLVLLFLMPASCAFSTCEL